MEKREPKKTEAQLRKIRRNGHKMEKEFVSYLIETQARNKPENRRWISFRRLDGHYGPILVVYVFDLDIDPNTCIMRTSITGGLGALLYQQEGSTVDFTTMNEADSESFTETGILPKGFYG